MGADAVRFAVGTLTVLPVGRHGTDRRVAGRAMLLAPLVGALVGVAAGAVVVGGRAIGLSPLLAAVGGVGCTALLTRGLHLDGLADLADGLGSRRPAEAALAVMRRSDIGPFGVVTVTLVLLLQVAALAELAAGELAVSGVVVAAVAGRCAMATACRTEVPAARPDGLGAHVAQTVGRGALPPLVVVCAGAAAAATHLDGGTWWRGALAVAAALTVAYAVERHAVRRLGGVTGDVLGALVETGTTVALVVLATG